MDVTITTERLLLRQFRQSDLDAYAPRRRPPAATTRSTSWGAIA